MSLYRVPGATPALPQSFADLGLEAAVAHLLPGDPEAIKVAALFVWTLPPPRRPPPEPIRPLRRPVEAPE